MSRLTFHHYSFYNSANLIAICNFLISDIFVKDIFFYSALFGHKWLYSVHSLSAVTFPLSVLGSALGFLVIKKFKTSHAAYFICVTKQIFQIKIFKYHKIETCIPLLNLLSIFFSQYLPYSLPFRDRRDRHRKYLRGKSICMGRWI